MGELKKMLNPETIAFIGADDCEGSTERAILDNLLTSQKKRLYAVNGNKSKALHIDCSPSVNDIDDHIDLAVIVAPDEFLLERVEECAKKGVEGAVIISTGPRSSAENRKVFEKHIWEIRQLYGMRIIGPDSNGFIMPNNGLKATFLKMNPVPGNTAFMSQSGTIGNAMLHRGVAQKIGFSMFMSLGSMVDVDFADIIDFLQEDYFTKSIMLYVEHVRDAKKFLSASRCFARNKPIVVLKPGRHPGSTEALTAHTGKETGRDAVYDAAFRRVGIVRVKETSDFFDTASVLVSKALPRGPRLAVITNSGGIGIIICDTLTEQRGRLAELSRTNIEKLGRIMPGSHGNANPLDILGDADVQRYIEATDICMKDEGVDGIIIVYAPTFHCNPAELAQSLAGLSKKTAKPLIAVWMDSRYSSEGLEYLREAAIPVYETPEEAVRAYMYMYHYRQGIELINETPEEIPQNEMRLTNHLKVIAHNATKEGKEVLTAEEAAGFLKNYGISVLKRAGHDNNTVQKNIVDEWAVRCIRDVDFGAVILLISMSGKMKQRTGFAVALPPLNRVLARRLIEDAEFPVTNKYVVKQMEEVLIKFSNLITDFPEFIEIEVETVVTDNDTILAKNAMIQLDTDYQKGIVQYPHLVIMPYPSRYIMPWKLRDGREAILRPLKAEDEPMIKEMLSSLAEETLRVRFFVVMEINHKMLMQFCNIDYDREIAIVAELKEGDKKRIAGGGRLIVEPDSESGQFALLVSDDFQRQGLGEKFLDITIGIAQDKGLKEIYGIVLTENDKMLGLSRKMGFKSTRLPDGITRVSMELD